MRFLYLSISADQACSLPSRHARTSRSSLHPVWGSCVSGRRVPGAPSRRATGPFLTPEQLLDAPERAEIEDYRPKVAERWLSADQDIGTRGKCETRDRHASACGHREDSHKPWG